MDPLDILEVLGEPPISPESAEKFKARARATPLRVPPTLGTPTVGDAVDTIAEMLPGVGEALSAADFAQAIRERNPAGMGLAGLGMVGLRFPGPRVKLSGTRELGGEISDAKSHTDWDVIKELTKSKRIAENQAVRLREILNHPELYKRYPELQGIPVKGMKGEGAAIVRNAETGNIEYIEIGNERAGPNDLLHEVQHGVQTLDGRMSLEKMPDRFTKYISEAVEREPNLTVSRSGLSEADLLAYPRRDDQLAQVRMMRDLFPIYREVEKKAKNKTLRGREMEAFRGRLLATMFPERSYLDAAKVSPPKFREIKGAEREEMLKALFPDD